MLNYKYLIVLFLATLKEYRAPLGGERQGISMKDTTYDGKISFAKHQVSGGLGKLTDEVYGNKELVNSVGSPWVAYDIDHPELEFVFQDKRLFHKIMIHVNNRGGDIQLFKTVDISISSTGDNYTLVRVYEPSRSQKLKADAFAVFIELSDVVARYMRLKFTLGSAWLAISEVVFLTDSYPPQRPFASMFPPQERRTHGPRPTVRARTWPWRKSVTNEDNRGPVRNRNTGKAILYCMFESIKSVHS